MLRNTRTTYRLIALYLCFIMLALSGCGKKENKQTVQQDSTTVFVYGENNVTLGETYIYINTIKDRYEKQYGEDVWEMTLPEDAESGESIVKLTKQEVVTEIIKVKTLCAHAEEYNANLSDEQLEQLKIDSETFYSMLTDEDIVNMELTQDIVYSVMYENAVASLVQERILEDDPVEISDEEARMTTFYDMYFPCYSINELGNVVEFTDEEKDTQYANALQACSTLATASIDENKDAENIENLAAYYKLEEAETKTFTTEEILDTYGKEIHDLLYSMENGDYSTVIESEYGYHVFQMIHLTDPEATAARKETMTRDAIDMKLSDTLSKWQEEIDPDFKYPDSVNMELYDTISLQ